MLGRVNPIVLLSLIVALVLSIGIMAKASGGSPGDAVGIAMGEIGKPYVFGTDGPGSYSCTGLMRYALRNAGVDDNAPWDHGGYLSKYPNDATPQVGDVVVYPDGVGMYIGDGNVVMANDADGVVGTYPMDSIGTPLGFANPYGGGGTSEPPTSDSVINDAAPVDTVPADPVASDPAPVDQPVLDPVVSDQPALDPTITDAPVMDAPVADQPAIVDPPVNDAPPVDPSVPLDPSIV